MLRVAVVNPPVTKVLEPEYDRPAFPRPVLAVLGGYLRRLQPETDVLLVDAKLERLDFDAVVERLRAAAPRVVGLTAFTNEIDDAAKLATRIRAALPEVLLVIGGVHVTALPVLTMTQFPAFDVAVVGEGEQSFERLCQAVSGGRSLEDVPGLYLRHDDHLLSTGPTPALVNDLDELGEPAWDMLPAARGYYRVMSERGCPYHCPFCMNPNGRKMRHRSVESMVAELQSLADRGYDYFEFDDEIFGADQKFCRALLQAIIDSGLSRRIRFYVAAHARFLKPDFVDLLARAGCDVVGFGMETGEEDRLLRIGKGLDRELVAQATRDCQAAGITVRGFFIIGHEGETWQSAMATLRFAVALNLDEPVFGIMVPYPGTRVWDLAIEGKGGYRRLSPSWKDYNKQVGGAVEMVALSRRRMELLQFLGYNMVFLRNGRFADWLRFAWQYRTAGISLVRNLLKKKARRRETDEIAGAFFDELLPVEKLEPRDVLAG